MRFLATLALALSLSACRVNPGGPCQGPCCGLECPASEGTITLRVVDDVTQQPVADLQVTGGDGGFIDIACASVVDGGSLDGGAATTDAGVPTMCAVWTLRSFTAPSFTLAAPGYVSRYITVDVIPTSSCCGPPFQDAERTETLHKQ